MNTVRELESIFLALQTLAQKLGRTELVIPLQRLREKNLRREWQLVVMGETSSGKSCLINSLVGKTILPEQPEPTTGQVVIVQTGTGLTSDCFSGLRPDGSKEKLTHNDFVKECMGRESWLFLRAELPQSTILPSGVVLVDTPGFNSCIGKHTEVLTDYLPQSDAIVYLTNYRRGMTLQDKIFLDMAIKSVGKDNLGSLFFAVNFSPRPESDPRIRTMQKQISDHLKRDMVLHIVNSVSDSPRRLCANTLWTELASSVEKMDLKAKTTNNLICLAEGTLTILAESIDIFGKAASAEEDGINELKKYMSQLKKDRQDADATVADYQLSLHRKVNDVVKRSLNNVSTKAGDEIKSSKSTDADACAAYIRGHFIQNEIDKISQETSQNIEILFCEMAENLDELAGRAEMPILGKIRVSKPGAGSALNKLRDQAIKSGSGNLASWYLRRIGGAVGEQAGLINLARMGVKRVGSVMGKKFGREVYTKVIPQIIRKIGIRASTAVNVFAYVITEVVVKIYHFATWKRSLKAVVDRSLGVVVTDEPLLDQLKQKIPFLKDKSDPMMTLLIRDFGKSIDEGIEETKGLINDDFIGRYNVAEEALKSRIEKPDSAVSKYKEMQTELDNIAHSILNIKSKEKIYEQQKE